MANQVRHRSARRSGRAARPRAGGSHLSLGEIAQRAIAPNPTVTRHEGWQIAAPMATTLFGLIPAGAMGALAQLILARRLEQSGATHIPTWELILAMVAAGIPVLLSIFLIRTFIRAERA